MIVSTKPLPLVSVVVPAYEAMQYLPEAIASVWAQRFSDFEVIVVNDGSTDDIVQWASTQTDTRFRFVSQQNQGLSGARNAGIRLALGEFIAFLDADDTWDPLKLEQQVEVLQRSPKAALVYTWSQIVDAKAQPTGRIFTSDAEGEVWDELILHNVVGCGSTPMVRRCCFDALGVFDEDLGSCVEDWDMWLRLAASYPFCVVKAPLVCYRQHENGASRRWREMEASYKVVLEKAFATAQVSHRKDLEGLKQRAYANAYLCLAWKPLQCRDKDVESAKQLRSQAVAYSPTVRQSSEYWRLSLAIELMQRFGELGYRRILERLYGLRRSVSLKR